MILLRKTGVGADDDIGFCVSPSWGCFFWRMLVHRKLFLEFYFIIPFNYRCFYTWYGFIPHFNQFICYCRGTCFILSTAMSSWVQRRIWKGVMHKSFTSSAGCACLPLNTNLCSSGYTLFSMKVIDLSGKRWYAEYNLIFMQSLHPCRNERSCSVSWVLIVRWSSIKTEYWAR